jgi:hypothetical protein
MLNRTNCIPVIRRTMFLVLAGWLFVFPQSAVAREV